MRSALFRPAKNVPVAIFHCMEISDYFANMQTWSTQFKKLLKENEKSLVTTTTHFNSGGIGPNLHYFAHFSHSFWNRAFSGSEMCKAINYQKQEKQQRFYVNFHGIFAVQ